MSQTTDNLTTILKQYKKGWLALSEDKTEVLAHAETFAEINEKISDHNPDEVVLFPLGSTQNYFVG